MPLNVDRVEGWGLLVAELCDSAPPNNLRKSENDKSA